MINKCFACEEIAESLRVIFENSYWMVTHKSGDDTLAGNLILKTKQHCEHLAQLTAEESASLGDMIQKTCLALSKVMAVSKIYVASFGEGVKHIRPLA